MKQLCLLLVLLFATSALAQNKIVAHNGSAAPRFYTSLDDALTNAQYDDVIYLSGGTFSTSIAINTKIRLVGVGWHPSLQYTGATNRTVITGHLTLTPNATGSNFEGFQVIGYIYFGQQYNTSTDPINNVSILKCNIQNGLYLRKPCSFITLAQSVIGSIVTDYQPNSWQNGSLDNSSFLNNAILYSISIRGQNNYFKNNIFFWSSNSILSSNNSTFDDNIFNNFPSGSISSCTFNRNINIGTQSYSTVNANNMISRPVSWTDIFENPGTSSSGDLPSFNPTNNYQLKESFRTAYPNVANAGIHYGDLGWNVIPNNPWIYEKNISTATDANGNLRAIIKVQARRD